MPPPRLVGDYPHVLSSLLNRDPVVTEGGGWKWQVQLDEVMLLMIFSRPEVSFSTHLLIPEAHPTHCSCARGWRSSRHSFRIRNLEASSLKG